MNFQFSYFGLLFNRCPPFPEPIQEEKKSETFSTRPIWGILGRLGIEG